MVANRDSLVVNCGEGRSSGLILGWQNLCLEAYDGAMAPRRVLLMFSSLLAVGTWLGCGPPPPSAQTVEKSIKYVVVFRLEVDHRRFATGCSYAATSDPRTEQEVAFRPSSEFVRDGCRHLQSKRWQRRAEGSANEEAFVPCFYSTAVPDQAICEE